jgi:hypothetical protein
MVRNLEEKVKPFVDQIDWMEVHHVASCSKKKSTIKKKCQATYKDTGFSTSVNQTHNGTTDRVAKPQMKQEAILNLEVVNGYVVLSQFLSTTCMKWAGSKKSLYFDSDGPERHERFASRIHEDNVFECICVSA